MKHDFTDQMPSLSSNNSIKVIKKKQNYLNSLQKVLSNNKYEASAQWARTNTRCHYGHLTAIQKPHSITSMTSLIYALTWRRIFFHCGLHEGRTGSEPFGFGRLRWRSNAGTRSWMHVLVTALNSMKNKNQIYNCCTQMNNEHACTKRKKRTELAATIHGSQPGVQSASLIMTSLMTSYLGNYKTYRKTETTSPHEILWAIQWWKPHRSTTTFAKPEITSFMTS